MKERGRRRRSGSKIGMSEAGRTGTKTKGGSTMILTDLSGWPARRGHTAAAAAVFAAGGAACWTLAAGRQPSASLSCHPLPLPPSSTHSQFANKGSGLLC